jgi:hypothetical protein
MNVDILIEKLCRLRDKYGEGMNVRLDIEVDDEYRCNSILVETGKFTVIEDDESGEALLHWDESMEG